MQSSTANPSTQAKATKHLPSLTGLRGFAAILVFWYHARWRAGEPSLLIGSIDFHNVLLASDSGVGIFFVLSGFLLSLPYWHNFSEHKASFIRLQPYFIRRLMRIAPAYYLSLIHTHIFATVTYTFWGIVSLGLYLAGLHTFFHQSYEWGYNPVLWTIGIEAQFYVLLPILFFIARKAALKKECSNFIGLLIITILCFILNPIYKHLILLIAPHLPAPIFGGSDAISSSTVNASTFYYLRWFWVGIIFAYVHHSKEYLFKNKSTDQKSFINADVLTLIGIFGTALVLLNASQGEWRSISLYGWPLNCIFFGFLVISVPFSHIGRLLFNNPTISFIGEISYGIYLWHWLIQVVIFKGSISTYLKGGQLLLVGGIISFIVTVFIASISYFLVEKPAINLGRNSQSFSDLLKKINSRFKLS
jgi:peptidoglycan/LPS O-acetylase OafA/YrhL